MERRRLNRARNDIRNYLRKLGVEGEADTAIVRIHGRNRATFELDVRKNRLVVSLYSPTAIDEMQLTKQQELLVLEQLAEQLGFTLSRRPAK